jgi:ABC-type metal ion transport system substrate-binding protein
MDQSDATLFQHTQFIYSYMQANDTSIIVLLDTLPVRRTGHTCKFDNLQFILLNDI